MVSGSSVCLHHTSVLSYSVPHSVAVELAQTRQGYAECAVEVLGSGKTQNSIP